MALTESEVEERRFFLTQAFSPSRPINSVDLFFGRAAQKTKLIRAVNQPGLHAVLHGERGVGKTSLANMIFPALKHPTSQVLVPQVNCQVDDLFGDIWKRVFEELLSMDRHSEKVALSSAAFAMLEAYTSDKPEAITGMVVKDLAIELAKDSTLVVVLDEFDTLGSDYPREDLTQAIKMFSDRAVPITIVLIGIAEDVDSLVCNHASVERNLSQIPMPRMSDEEVASIITRSLERASMSADSESLEELAKFARGLPHYAHLLGMHAGDVALDELSEVVRKRHVKEAITRSLDGVQASIRQTYLKATRSPQTTATFPQILLACALTTGDEMGYFYASGIKDSLSKLLGKPAKLEHYSRNLHRLCDPKRGEVLRATEDPLSASKRFRFSNALLQPYVIMKGLADGLITDEDLRQ